MNNRLAYRAKEGVAVTITLIILYITSRYQSLFSVLIVRCHSHRPQEVQCCPVGSPRTAD
jgi:preprotein translocase subunit SecF